MKEVFTSETFQTLSDYIDAFMEDHDIYDYENVTIVIEKAKDDTPAGYHWKATLMPNPTADALKGMLVENGYVDFFVSSEEIRMVAEDMQRELSDEEVASVMEFLSHNDLETGLCELAIEGAISEVCPDGADQEWEEEEDESDGVDLNKSAWDIVQRNFTPDI